MAAAPFRINPAFDAELWAARFAATGRVHIPDFLVPEDAERLLLHLKGSDQWRLVVNQADKLFELDRAAQQNLDHAGRTSLEQAVHAAARHEFQFMFETIRVPDSPEARHERGDLLSTFATFLSSPEMLGLLRAVTGQPAVEFADAQATAYGLGHFLTVHDDDVAGKNRFAAYVLNLTPSWRADWGGLLLFHRPDGHIEEALTPSFNALNLFAVPQPHSVSMVAPFAPYRRYSVTGWLRAR